MRLHRFIGDYDLTQRELPINDPEVVHQVSNVFRLGKGDRILLCDGKAKEAETEILDAAENSINVKVLSVSRNLNEPAVDVSLYCAILKKENLEFVVQKAVETGAKRIVPVLTQRTVKLGADSDRLRKIAKEAAEQSGRCFVPIVEEPMEFSKALEDAGSRGKIVFYAIGADEMRPETVPHVSLFIGPEGGWDDQELELARQHDALVVGLGSLILRSETAAILVTFLASHP